MSVSAADESIPWDLQLGRDWQPPDQPSEWPHPLRMWDYMVGGKDNFQVDRDAAELAIKYVPNVLLAARAGEAFIVRALRYVAGPEYGIDQYLHLGCYIAKLNSPSLGGITHPSQTGKRYVFVTDDQVSAAHARAVLAARTRGGSEVHALWADFRDPAPILASPWLSERIDLSRPVALTQLRTALAPGSMVVMVHLLQGADLSATERAMRESLGHNPYQYTPRSLERVRELVSDFEFVDPGFVRCTSWRPDGEGPGQDMEMRCSVAGGVAIVR